MEPTDSANVTFDLPCVSCGYNLKTLGWDARCPECSAQVAESRNLELRATSVIALRFALVAFAAQALAFAMLAAHVGAFDSDILLGFSRSRRELPYFQEAGPAFFAFALVACRLLLAVAALHLLDLCVTGRHPHLRRHGGGFVGIACVAALFTAVGPVAAAVGSINVVELLMFPAAEIFAAGSACQLHGLFADLATSVNRPALSRSVRQIRVAVLVSAVWTALVVVTFVAASRWNLSDAEGLDLLLVLLLVPWTMVALAQAVMMRRLLRAVRPACALDRGANPPTG